MSRGAKVRQVADASWPCRDDGLPRAGAGEACGAERAGAPARLYVRTASPTRGWEVVGSTTPCLRVG